VNQQNTYCIEVIKLVLKHVISVRNYQLDDFIVVFNTCPQRSKVITESRQQLLVVFRQFSKVFFRQSCSPQRVHSEQVATTQSLCMMLSHWKKKMHNTRNHS